MSDIIFISGIDTDAGKTYATAWLANRLIEKGKRVITQKFIQTGNEGYSEDIIKHRELMNTELFPEDKDFTTSPVIFSYPASAQLAARIDGKEIDLETIRRSTSLLASRYDTVLIEGAGGLMVPITDSYFTIDYIADENLPIALVTNGILGSINHTILSLEAIKNRGIKLRYLLYNTYFDKDKIIADDTKGFISRYLKNHFPESEMIIF
ncbi:ATP-dependent dethiobiotin synthetase BioD [Barnesiella sp. WM24]|uniref:dethiobiotin synthase n=1 Tax=Barnesiella sp. WM24 TaxID=2558278 RepID=UPI001072156C|nr:dethiobiotin synthase [Barnesiella sp. WM24]TFU93715.1 ATP-dependent dethiobiotin synthetase BioD [Barnesiella sp. WM24]